MKQNNKLAMMLVAVVASTVLWLYVVTVVNPEDSVTITNIPVVFSGEDILMDDQNLIVTDGAKTTVTLKLTGKRSDLKDLDRDNVLLTADLSKITKTGAYRLNYTITYLADVNPSNFTVEERKPNNISIMVERMVTATIPVKGVFNGEVADGYMTEEMLFDHDELTIRGTEEAVSKISYAQVILERSNLDKTITQTTGYTLIGTDGEPVEDAGVITDVDEIEVTLPVVKYKQIPLTVDVVDGGGATASKVTCEIEPKNVTISGEASVIDGINQIVLGTVDLTKTLNDETLEFPILIPNDSKNVSGDETAKVTVKFNGLETRVVRVSSVEFINVADGFRAESMTQLLQATIRASASVLNEISPNNVRAVADLSEYTQPGTYTVPVTIYIDGYAEAGAVGEYTIVLSLTEK